MRALFLASLIAGIAFSVIACEGPDDATDSTISSPLAGGDKLTCGGILGEQCPPGMTCRIKDSFPDAQGVCVGKAKIDCSAVKCAGCPEGTIAKTNSNSCCPRCIPDNTKECTTIALCVEGYVWDTDTCQCEPDGGGDVCGDVRCGAGMVCCNSSCGICTEPGGFCIEIACQ